MNVTSTKDAVRTFLPQELSEYNRRTRISEFVQELNTNEIQEIILPFAAKVCSPYNCLVSRCKALSWRNATNANNLARSMQKEYTDLSRDIAENDPEVSRIPESCPLTLLHSIQREIFQLIWALMKWI